MPDQINCTQSDFGCRPRVVIDAAGGCCWEICRGQACLQDRSGARLERRYRELLEEEAVAP